MEPSNHTAGHNYKCCCDSYSAVNVSSIGAAVGLAITAAVLLCLLSKGCRSWLTNKVGIGLNWRSSIFFSLLWPVSLVCMLLAPPTHTAWLYWPALVLQCLGVVHIVVAFVIYVADVVLDLRRDGRVSEDSMKATGPLYLGYNRLWGVELTPQSELRRRRREIPLRENPDGEGEDGGERTADGEEKESDIDVGTGEAMKISPLLTPTQVAALFSSAGTVFLVCCSLSCRAFAAAINVALSLWVLWIVYKAYECVREGGI